ncbi:MAG: amidohydrolase [Erysipelotrichaceae bacterium]|nr:amidohydrolase [Erysipelotrichaceae bacterium]
MKKLILGNVTTMNENNMHADAIVVEDGKILYVGNKEEAKSLYGNDLQVLDYSDKYILPGFIEPHSHGIFAGYRALGQLDLSSHGIDYEAYKKDIRQYVKDNPDFPRYLTCGWSEDGSFFDHNWLDELCSDKPMIMNTCGGHSCLLNKKAMEVYGINKDYLAKYGKERVHIYDNGELTGYVCEEAAVDLFKFIQPSFEDAKRYILGWQDIALSKGYTAVGDAGCELLFKDASHAYNELDSEKKLKLRTYSWILTEDNCEDPVAKVEQIKEIKKQYDGDYYQVIGSKVFLDGVAEGRTSWTVDEYCDEKGYYGIQRFNNEERMVTLIAEANKNNFSVHAHSEGDGSTRFMLRCIKKAQDITNVLDQRNLIAHLHFVQPEDIDNMAKTKSIAIVPPLWTPKFKGGYEPEVKAFGLERSDASYPIKSFVDAGATIAFHSDYPISPVLDVVRSLYMAELRALPDEGWGGVELTQRNPKECINRLQALRALTIDAAYALKQENIMGSIEVGKIANFTVYDQDILNIKVEDVINAKLLKTIVDGEEVYSI